MERLIKLFLFLLGIFILAILVYKIGFFEIAETISRAKLDMAFLGIIIFLSAVLVRAYKWFYLFRVNKYKIKFKDFLPIYFINTLISNITPYKSGQALTPFLFKKYLKIPVGRGFFVIFLDGFFELFIFVFFLAGAVFYTAEAGIKNSFAGSVFRNIFISLFFFIFLLLIVILYKKITLKILGIFSFLKKWQITKKAFRFIEKQLNVFYNDRVLLKNKKVYFSIIPLTIIAWCLEIISFYFIFNSVFSVSFLKLAASQIISAAAVFISFIPGGLGVAEATVVYVLGLFNYSNVLSASGILFIRLIFILIFIFLGLIGYFLLGRLNKDR